MKVLIIDDAMFMRMMIRNILESSGIEVVGEAASGSEGIEKYKELMPDVVIMDITMPNISGIDATREIAKVDKEARILMCSVMGQGELIRESIKAGARGFVVKPFEPKKLVAEVRRIGKTRG